MKEKKIFFSHQNFFMIHKEEFQVKKTKEKKNLKL